MIEPQSVVDGVGGQLLGHYRATLITGLTTGMAANAPIASFRWTDANVAPTAPTLAYMRPRIALLLGIDAGAVVTTAFTTGQSTDIEAIIARSFTASDSGGSAITVPSKLRSTFGASLVGDLRVAGAAALTPGTRTLDGTGFACATIYNQNSAGSGDTQQSIYSLSREGQYPITLATNEGFILRVPTAQGAVGVVKYFATIEWIEVSVEGASGFHPA